jgi:hypothetical protein
MAINSAGKISRRSLIVGAGGVAGAASIGAGIGTMTPFAALGATVPVRQDIVEFAKDTTRLGKFQAAVKEMQDRSRMDRNDPKGWLINARAHADFCSLSSQSPKQIHFCYWFLCWHRAYIHVTELKIRQLGGDATFSYPYWNWSSDRHIPQAYAQAGSSLSNAIRNTPGRAVQDGEVDYVPSDPVLKKLGVAALGVTIFEATTSSQINRSFGGIARPNPANSYGNNRLEGTPHGPIHNYVGGDMGDFETAGRDPIFFAHHGNLDRLWEIWRQDPIRKKSEPTANAFLNHTFVFTWLDGATMQVSVKDTLDTKKLNYVYDSLEVFRPNAPPVLVAQAAEQPLPPVATQKLTLPLAAQAAGETGRKILQITDVQKPDMPMTVGVYLKASSAPADQPGTNVGSFAAVRAGGVIEWPSQTLSFDITDAATKLAGQELTVQLIPYRIGAQGTENYPPLKYGQMRIVTEK